MLRTKPFSNDPLTHQTEPDDHVNSHALPLRNLTKMQRTIKITFNKQMVLVFHQTTTYSTLLFFFDKNLLNTLDNSNYSTLRCQVIIWCVYNIKLFKYFRVYKKDLNLFNVTILYLYFQNYNNNERN